MKINIFWVDIIDVSAEQVRLELNAYQNTDTNITRVLRPMYCYVSIELLLILYEEAFL